MIVLPTSWCGFHGENESKHELIQIIFNYVWNETVLYFIHII